MSVLIKGMKMPKDCHECRFCSGYMTGQARILGYVCLASLKKEDSVRGRRKLEELCTESIPDWCPLVELPEKHGNLIDRDDLKREYRMGNDCNDCETDWKSCQYDIVYSKMDFCGWLDDTPVVIEAEGE